jgi:hypothetical protein
VLTSEKRCGPQVTSEMLGHVQMALSRAHDILFKLERSSSNKKDILYLPKHVQMKAEVFLTG